MRELRPASKVIADDDVPRRCHQQSHRHVGRRVVQASRSISHRQPPFVSIRNDNMINADSVIADNLQIRHAIHQCPVDSRMSVRDHADTSRQGLGAFRSIPGENLIPVAQHFQQRRRQPITHNRSCHLHSSFLFSAFVGYDKRSAGIPFP